MLQGAAINTRARYTSILLSKLGLGINFIQWISLRSYNDTQFVAVALFVVTPAVCLPQNYANWYISLICKPIYIVEGHISLDI